ncbi:MAG: AAA family ATPase [Bacillota bacterium]|nr:AAA family ATPase [Bacillota bacterium]
MAREFAIGLYKSKKWEKCRDSFMSSKNYICERCGDIAVICHHKKYITPENINDPNITLNWNNLEALCRTCHAAEHMSMGACAPGLTFDESGNLVKINNAYLICGSPGSGKSTWVKEHKHNDDIVIDLDYICAALMGEPDNIYLNHEPVLAVALEVQKLLYQIIKAKRGKWRSAYVITSTPSKDKQNKLAKELDAKIIVMETTLTECIERIKNDQRRASSTEKFIELAKQWYENFTSSPPGLTN